MQLILNNALLFLPDADDIDDTTIPMVVTVPCKIVPLLLVNIWYTFR